MSRNPDVDPQPIPPDDAEDPPLITPPKGPGYRREDEPDPPPQGDPPSDEPTRVFE